MSVLQNINGTLYRMDASDLVQLAAVDTEGILGGTPGATTNGQTLVDQLAADDVQAQTDIGQIKTDLSDLEDDMSKYHVVPSRNHLVYPYTYSGVRQSCGITFREVENGAVSLNGTNDGTGVSEWYLTGRLPSQGAEGTYKPLYLPIGRYVFALSGQYANLCGINVAMTVGGSYVSVVSAVGEPVTFEITANTACDYKLSDGSCLIGFIVNVPKNTSRTFANDIVYPMVYTASDYAADPSYEPYFLPMRDGKLDITDYAKSGSVNHFNNTAAAQTVNNVVLSVDSNKVVTLNGTPTSGTKSYFQLGRVNVKAGQYLTGCPANGGNSTYELILFNSTETGRLATDTGNGAVVSQDHDNAQLGIYVHAAVSSLKFYPMIADIKDAPYVPFAYTNIELTGAKKIPLTFTSGYFDSVENYISLYVCGSIGVFCGGYTKINTAIPANTIVFTLPFKLPASQSALMLYTMSPSAGIYPCRARANGEVFAASAIPAGIYTICGSLIRS